MGGGALVIVIIALIFLFVIGRAKQRADKQSMVQEGRSRGWQEIKRKLRQNKLAAWTMRRVFRLRNEVFPDELPFDIKDMSRKIETVLSMDQTKRQGLIKKGMIKSKGFSWDTAAGKIIELLYER